MYLRFITLAVVFVTGSVHAGGWESVDVVDEITDERSRVISLASDSAKEEFWISCLNGGLHISVNAPGLQPYDGMFKVDYRFDKKPGVVDSSWYSALDAAYSLETYEFLDELLLSGRLVFRIQSESMPARTMRFNLKGVREAIDGIYELCPPVSSSDLSKKHRATRASCYIENIPIDEPIRVVACVLREEKNRQWLAANAQDPGVASQCAKALSGSFPFASAKQCVEALMEKSR